jgi:hypothetical protein
MSLAGAGAAFAVYTSTFADDFGDDVQAGVEDICAKLIVAQKAAAASILAGSDVGFSTAQSAVQAALIDLGDLIAVTHKDAFDTYAGALVGEL